VSTVFSGFAEAFAEPVRQDMGRYFARAAGPGTGPWRIEEFGERSPGFGHDDLIACLQRLLTGQEADGAFTELSELMTRACVRNVPFPIVVHELAFLRDRLTRLAVEEGNLDAIGAIIVFFDELKDMLARIYLGSFLGALGHRNNVRLRHIAALAEKNLLVHFEKHLDWLKQLTQAVSARDGEAMPEAHHERCEFGKWLHGEGASLVRDQSHHAHLVDMHAAMHRVVDEIADMMGHQRDSLPLYALMKKAENYSLDIGNEIAMLNSMVIMTHYNKDPMTGGLTRRSLERVMINQLEISKATETPFCLLMCDVDHFKQINDNHGHTAGDRAIVRFADVLRGNLRQADLLFRFGGDEFLIMLPSTGYAQGLEVAGKLRSAVAGLRMETEHGNFEMRASFGLLEVSGSKTAFIDSELVNNLIKECDQRLYLAKHRGRNQVA
jgi:diguanylate cyclase (GGDEF)-like protein